MDADPVTKPERLPRMKHYVGVVIVSCVLGAAIILITTIRTLFGPSGDEPSSSAHASTSKSPQVRGSTATAVNGMIRNGEAPLSAGLASLPPEFAGKHDELLRDIDDLSESERMEASDLAQRYALGLDVGRIVRWRPVLFDIDAVFDADALGTDYVPSPAPRSRLTITPFEGFELRFLNTGFYQSDAGASWVGELLDVGGEVTVYVTYNENDSRIARAMLVTDLGVFNIVYLGHISNTETQIYFVSEANRYFKELSH